MVDVPQDRHVISVKDIYKTKKDANGNVQKHKARLVGRGFTQKSRIDFNETFSPIVHSQNLLAIVVKKKWHVYQMDVKLTFLNGHL